GGFRHHASSPHAGPAKRRSATTAKVSPVSRNTAEQPLIASQRRKATPQYGPSISIARQRRPTASAARSIEPEPAKQSMTTSPRLLTSSNASSSSARGFTVGWEARPSRASDPRLESPSNCYTLDS